MKKLSLLSTSALIVLGLTNPAAAFAQAGPTAPPEAEDVDRVVVTAQKQEQELIDVPINISVATQEQLDLLGTDDIEEYADYVPGLQVQAQSLNTSSYSLRGVTSDGGRPRVAVYENGVAIGNPRFAANTAMFDLERIEVVKGPQATLFGQGALVGGINFIQNRASFSGNEGWAKLDAGDYGYLRAEAGYNVALSDTFALRVAGLSKSRDGYVPNVSNGPDLMGQETSAVRVAAAWQPLDNLRADLIINYEENDSTGTQFKSGVFAPPGGDLSPFTGTANNITGSQLRDKLGADRQIFSVTANIAWEINDDWTLTSVTSERSLEDLEAFDSDGAAFSLLQFASVDNAQVWSQELRFNFDDGGPITAFFGGNYYTQDHSVLLRLNTEEGRAQAFLSRQLVAGVNQQMGTNFTVATFKQFLQANGVPGAANFDNIVNPMQVSALLALQGLIVPLHNDHVEETFSNGEQTSYDLFGDVSWEISDQLTVTGGLRYTVDELYSDTLVYLVKGNPALGGTRNALTGGTTLVSLDSQGVPDARSYDADGEFTWRLNAAYRVSDDLNTWIAVGRGRRPPSLSSNINQPTGFEVVDQETYDNIEIGLHTEAFDDRLSLTASTYYGEYKNFQTTRYDVTQGTFITENSGNATSYGVEIDGRFEAADFLDLYGTLAYTHARYDDEDSDGNPLEFAGNRFRLSPLHSASIAANFHMPWADFGEVFFVPSYVWKSSHYFEDDNDPWEFQESYGILDLKIGFDAADGVWGAAFYVENALDEEYLIDAGNTGGDFGIPTYIRGVPQMLGAGAWVKF